MANVNVELERSVWSYKKVEDSELANKNIEIILNFYDKNRFELNINKFSSSFNIDLETFLDNTNDNSPLSDDVFSSNYHHSLILGSFYKEEDDPIVKLIIEKVFTNEQEIYSENTKEVKMEYLPDSNTLSLDSDSVLGRLASQPEAIILKQIKQIKPMK